MGRLELFRSKKIDSVKKDVPGELTQSKDRTFVRLGQLAFPLIDAKGKGGNPFDVLLQTQGLKKVTVAQVWKPVMWQSEWDQPKALQNASPLEIPDSEKIKRQFNTFLLGCIKKDNNMYDLKEKPGVFNCGDIVSIKDKKATVLSGGKMNSNTRSVIVMMENGSIREADKRALRKEFKAISNKEREELSRKIIQMTQ